MYIPNHYEEDSWEFSQHLIKSYPLGTLITSDGELIANHIPFFLKEDETGKYLIAHMRKINHQVPSLNSGKQCLVVFQSPDSYIAPKFYPTKQETHKVVPTWDFAAAHIYGSPKIIDDKQWVRKQLDLLTAQEEKVKGNDWTVDEAPKGYIDIMQKLIVGLEIKIDRSECKYKFEQGKNKQDVEGTINGLEEQGEKEVALYVREANTRTGTL